MSTRNNKEDGGVFFDPYDDELINKYLLRKLKGKDCGNFIVTKNVYEKEPWLLDHTKHPIFKENEWYYFVTRTQVSQKNIGCGKKSKRKIMGDGDGGNWKANVKIDIKDVDTEKVIGIKQTLTFKKSNDNQKKQKTGDGTSVIVPGSDSTWTMYEYMLPDEDTFQELVLCKIKKSKTKDDDRPNESIPDSSSEQQPTNIDHQTVLAPSSLEQQQPWLCGGNGPEIPPMGCLSSLTCYAAETEGIGEHSGEGNMGDQIDAFSMIEKVPERSLEKDGKFEAMEVTQKVEDDDLFWIGDLMDKYTTNGLEAVLGINTEDQQQPPITAPAHRNVVAPARLGVKALPVELDDDSGEDKQWEATATAFMLNFDRVSTGSIDPSAINRSYTRSTNQQDLSRSQKSSPNWIDQS